MVAKNRPTPAVASALGAMTPAAAITDGPLAYAFQGASWAVWRAVLKAAWAEPLTAEELVLFHSVAGDRPPPARRVSELWAIAGRRSGKDAVASAICACLATGDYSDRLRPGERAAVLALANDREQAAIARNYIVGLFQETPVLRALVKNETTDGLELANRVDLLVGTNSFRAVRGRSILAVVLDECAFYRSEGSANPADELYAALRPGMATLRPHSLLIGISSSHRRAGLLFDKWKQHFGQPDDDVLVIRGPTPLFNPTIDRAEIDRDLERDPERYGAEWLAEWRSDLSDFLDRDLVESAVEPGMVVRAPQPGVEYTAFADASGGRGDSFTLAVAHAEEGVAVLDTLYERRAPFNPGDVLAEIAELLRSYGVARVVGDRYAAQWVTAGFAGVGIHYETSERDRSKCYLDTLPLFAAGQVRLLDSPRLVHQLVSLERRQSRFGRDSVNHPDGGADDVANAAAGALVLAVAEKRPALIRTADLAPRPGTEIDLRRTGAVFATLWVGADGMAGWAAFSYMIAGTPNLLVRAFDRIPWAPALLPDLAARLDAMCEEVRNLGQDRPIHATLMVPDQIAVSADAAMAEAFAARVHRPDARFRNVRAEAIDAKFLADPTGLALRCGGIVSAGDVALTDDARGQANAAPLLGLLAVRPGETVMGDPLRVAALLGIAMLAPEADFDPPALPTARMAFG